MIGNTGKLGRPTAQSGERLIEGRLRTLSRGPELLSILFGEANGGRTRATHGRYPGFHNWVRCRGVPNASGETRRYSGGERKLDVCGVLGWEAAVTSEPVAFSRERLPGVPWVPAAPSNKQAEDIRVEVGDLEGCHWCLRSGR